MSVREIRCREIRCQFVFSGKNDELTPDFPPDFPFRPDVLDQGDLALSGLAVKELSTLLGIKGEPIVRHVSRWPNVMPQYELGHLALVQSIESAIAAHSGLALAGNAYHGVGVPQCIQSGEQAAERIARELGARIAGTTLRAMSAAHNPPGDVLPSRRDEEVR